MIGDLRTGLIRTSEGSTHQPRSDREGSQVVTLSGGTFREAALNKQLCFSYCASRATSLPTTAMIGNIVWNPPGSGMVLSLCSWDILIHVTSATCIGITLGYAAQAITPTTTTAADAQGNCYLNAGSPGQSVAKAYAIGTLLVAPTPVVPLFHNTAAINTVGVDKMSGNFEGIWIVPPGYAVAFCALEAAVAAAGMTSTLVWEELKE